MPSPRLTVAEVHEAIADLPDWVYAAAALHARHEAPDVPAALELATEVFGVAEDIDHHPDLDIRWKRLRWRVTTHESGGVTHLDVDLAGRISALARTVAATALDPHAGAVHIGIDTDDQERIAPFWAAALGYRREDQPDGGIDLVDPAATGPVVWFQQTDAPAAGRNRVHLDVYVPADHVPARRAAIEAAGGRLVTDEFAPRWWVYADADGNEVCLSPPTDPRD